MAAPKQTGFNYFSLECNWRSDHKVLRAEELIDPKFNQNHLRVTLREVLSTLWGEIYKDKGYYMEWNFELAVSLARNSFFIDSQLLQEIIDALIKAGLFDAHLFTSHNIITSRGVQKRWSNVCVQLGRHNPTKGRFVEYNPDLILLTPEELFAKTPRPPQKNKTDMPGHNPGSARAQSGFRPPKNVKSAKKWYQWLQKQFKEVSNEGKGIGKGKGRVIQETWLKEYYNLNSLFIHFLPVMPGHNSDNADANPDSTQAQSGLVPNIMELYPGTMPVMPGHNANNSGHNNNSATNTDKPKAGRGRPPKTQTPAAPAKPRGKKDLLTPDQAREIYLSEPMANSVASYMEQNAIPTRAKLEDWIRAFHVWIPMAGILEPRTYGEWVSHFYRWMRQKYDPSVDPATIHQINQGAGKTSAGQAPKPPPVTRKKTPPQAPTTAYLQQQDHDQSELIMDDYKTAMNGDDTLFVPAMKLKFLTTIGLMQLPEGEVRALETMPKHEVLGMYREFLSRYDKPQTLASELAAGVKRHHETSPYPEQAGRGPQGQPG